MKLKTRELTFIALAAALMAVFSQIALPIGSVNVVNLREIKK